MSDLFRSALGYLSNSVGSQGVGGGNNGGGGAGGGGVGGGGSYASASGGGSEEGSSSVGDVVAFTFQGKTRNVRINKLIAEGGFSYVYRGVEVQTGEAVAIKKMLSVDVASLKSVEEEVEFLGQLSHVNVVRFFGSSVRRRSGGGKRSEHFLAMEFCPVRLPTPPLRIQHTAQVFAQTCRAVKYLHDFGIVHRDIKLENLLIGVDGLLKLVDFGSCTMEKVYPSADWSMSRRTIVEEEMAAKTTPMYRAPEMLDLWSNHPIDERVDLWALGCLLFALNFGQHPFHDSNKLAILNANYSLPKGVSDSGPIVSVIRGLLRVDPGERLGIGGVFEVLQSIAESQGFALGEPLPFKPIASPVVPGREGFVEGGGGGERSSEDGGGGGIVNPLSGRVVVETHASGGGYSSGGGGGGGAVIGGSSLLSSLKGGAASLLKNIKEQSQQYLAAQPVAPQQAGGPQQQSQVPSGGGVSRSSGPPSRPPPPGGQGRSANIEFENKEYEEHHQQPKRPPPPRPAPAAAAAAPPPSRPAPPKPPPPQQQKREATEEIIPPAAAAVIVDDLLDIETSSSTLSSSVPGAAVLSNADLLGDLFGGGGGVSGVGGVPSTVVVGGGEDDLFWGATQSSSSNNNAGGSDLLLGDSFASILNVGAAAGGGGRGQQQTATTFPFGSTSLPQQAQQQPVLQPSSSSFHNLSNSQQQQQQPGGGGLLDAGGRGFMQNKNSSSPNLSDLILDDLMGTGKPPKQPPQQQQQSSSISMNKSNPSLNKPNYNRSTIFDSADAAAGGASAVGGKQTLNDVFGDILTSQGFGGVGGGGPVGPGGRTINEMRRIEAHSSPSADPVALKISEWREGKKKNIRALLASLHTVTWEGCSWEETNMSQMVSPAQVKKTYRKACLAVHPDKQMGMEWECLAKMIFVELNEAWAAFEDQLI